MIDNYQLMAEYYQQGRTPVKIYISATTALLKDSFNSKLILFRDDPFIDYFQHYVKTTKHNYYNVKAIAWGYIQANQPSKFLTHPNEQFRQIASKILGLSQ